MILRLILSIIIYLKKLFSLVIPTFTAGPEYSGLRRLSYPLNISSSIFVTFWPACEYTFKSESLSIITLLNIKMKMIVLGSSEYF